MMMRRRGMRCRSAGRRPARKPSPGRNHASFSTSTLASSRAQFCIARMKETKQFSCLVHTPNLWHTRIFQKLRKEFCETPSRPLQLLCSALSPPPGPAAHELLYAAIQKYACMSDHSD